MSQLDFEPNRSCEAGSYCLIIKSGVETHQEQVNFNGPSDSFVRFRQTFMPTVLRDSAVTFQVDFQGKPIFNKTIYYQQIQQLVQSQTEPNLPVQLYQDIEGNPPLIQGIFELLAGDLARLQQRLVEAQSKIRNEVQLKQQIETYINEISMPFNIFKMAAN